MNGKQVPDIVILGAVKLHFLDIDMSSELKEMALSILVAGSQACV